MFTKENIAEMIKEQSFKDCRIIHSDGIIFIFANETEQLFAIVNVDEVEKMAIAGDINAITSEILNEEEILEGSDIKTLCIKLKKDKEDLVKIFDKLIKKEFEDFSMLTNSSGGVFIRDNTSNKFYLVIPENFIAPFQEQTLVHIRLTFNERSSYLIREESFSDMDDELKGMMEKLKANFDNVIATKNQ